MELAIPRPGTGSSAASPRAPARFEAAGKLLARGGERLRIHGVTYGPFAPNEAGEPFPNPDRVAEDLAAMTAAGINTIRTYHVPPDWLLGRAEEEGIAVLVDVPWPSHVCFLDSRRAGRDAREAVRQAAERGRRHGCVLAYSVGNEIAPDILRWHGARRVERFLAELGDVARQADPDGLVTYANYPPTEYLDLSFLDFATFNVYLHDREAFRRYLFRLQNLVGDRPLLLGEVGMDTLRHGEPVQAHVLSGHLREALLMGVAGGFVFSWTDEWHTGGHPVQDWAFGITQADRSPKVSYHALRQVYRSPLAALLPRAPRVSVIVCSYNGGRTLEQCLHSLRAIDYPDYEVIVVDDGSTDDTPAILARFPEVRAIRQAQQGLSVARNTGLHAATGEIIAYTDSDCFVDPDWLTHLVHQLERSRAGAVGGPNLTPEDGWLAGCVAAAPGQPTHVLVSDQVAEHIPGCNMAFRRGALEAIHGFDPQYRKAGDDVDVCWRLQQAGQWITFAPGAFVWHHRRATPRAYFRQQAGYGEAEALLRFKHPDQFNGWGDGKWRGVLYGPSLRGLHLNGAIIYRGTFSTGLFQCLYQPAPAHWAMLPSTLEWHLAAAVAALAALFWGPAWFGALGMVAASVAVAALQAMQTRLPPRYEGLGARLLILSLCYAQPLVRSWQRYRTRFFSYRPPVVDSAIARRPGEGLPLTGMRTVNYWNEDGCERTRLLGRLSAFLNDHGWGRTLDSGWEGWDLEVYCHPWTIVQICTVQEEHGGGKRLIRVRYRLRLSSYTRGLGLAATACALFTVGLRSWPSAGMALALAAGCVAAWWRGLHRARRLLAVVDALAQDLGLLRCSGSRQIFGTDTSGTLASSAPR